jgi:hypothetical protein
VESERPHIVVSYIENIPIEIPRGILDAVQHPDLKLVENPIEGFRPFATVEWLLPTAVAVFVTKAYFDAFLKEMGKDHYNLLKKGILSVWNRLFRKDSEPRMVLIGTEGKTKSTKYSLAFSVWSELNTEYNVKFLFEDRQTEDQFEKNVSLILQFLKTLHSGEGDMKNYLIMEEDVRHVGRTVLIAFDKESQKLRMVSPIPDTKET